MFINLCLNPQFSATFVKHNFRIYLGLLEPVPDPASDLELALLDSGSYPPNTDLIPTLCFTLSPACCRSFLEKHRGMPLTERDYYLSKLYQFFSLALLHEERGRPEIVADHLEEILDSTFADRANIENADRANIENLALLEWVKIFVDYKRKDLENIIGSLPSYLPAPPGKAFAAEDSNTSVGGLSPRDQLILAAVTPNIVKILDNGIIVKKYLGPVRTQLRGKGFNTINANGLRAALNRIRHAARLPSSAELRKK